MVSKHMNRYLYEFALVQLYVFQNSANRKLKPKDIDFLLDKSRGTKFKNWFNTL